MARVIHVDPLLRWAILAQADLRATNLSHAKLINTNLAGADLTGAMWVDATHQCSNQSCDAKAY